MVCGEESGNASKPKMAKKLNLELQGKFRKIKCPFFNGDAKEATEAWIINVNKYYQVYEYDNHLKARLSISQL